MSHSVGLEKCLPLVQRMISSRFLLITFKIVILLSAADTFVLLNAIRGLPVQSVPYLKQTDRQKRRRVAERQIFFELPANIAGSEVNDQVAFLID